MAKALVSRSYNDSFDQFRAQVRAIKMLSHEEEIDLAAKKAQGDLKAAERLVTSHLPLVMHISSGLTHYGIPQNDLVQEGTIGLMKAVRDYDVSRGVRLSNYATPWIRASMYEHIVRNYRTVKIATTKSQRKLFFNLRSMRSKADGTALSSYEVKQIADKLNVPEEEVREMDMRFNGYDVSTSVESNNDDENHLNPLDYLADDGADPAEQYVGKLNAKVVRGWFNTAISLLDDRSRAIIQARYLDEEKKTLHDLAAVYGVSYERIRQIEVAAFKKMRKVVPEVIQ